MGTEEIRDRLEDDALKRQPEEEKEQRKDQETRNGEIEEEDKGHGTCTEDTPRDRNGITEFANSSGKWRRRSNKGGRRIRAGR